MLVHTNPNAQIRLITDASNIAMSGVLERHNNKGIWMPLGFFSRKLRDTKTQYSAYDKELLAIKLAIRHFKWQLEGRTFTVYTDHKPLTFAMSRKSAPWSDIQHNIL